MSKKFLQSLRRSVLRIPSISDLTLKSISDSMLSLLASSKTLHTCHKEWVLLDHSRQDTQMALKRPLKIHWAISTCSLKNTIFRVAKNITIRNTSFLETAKRENMTHLASKTCKSQKSRRKDPRDVLWGKIAVYPVVSVTKNWLLTITDLSHLLFNRKRKAWVTDNMEAMDLMIRLQEASQRRAVAVLQEKSYKTYWSRKLRISRPWKSLWKD